MRRANSYTFRLILSLTLVLLLTTLGIKQVEAQQDLSIGMAPNNLLLNLKPGEKYAGDITLWNLAQKGIEYDISIDGFRQIENKAGTAIKLSKDDEKNYLYSASSWITTNKERITLIPNKNEKLLFEIKVPLDIANGEYNAMISFTSSDKSKTTSNSTHTTLSSGVPILIKVGDNFIEKAKLVDFSTIHKIYEKPTLNFDTKISNLGNTHISPTGEIVLKNIFNQEIDRIKFNPNRQSILRENIGEYKTEWSTRQILSKDNKVILGPIKANITITYRQFQPGFAPLTAELSLWIIPWKIIAITVASITLLTILIKVIKAKKK